jgi:WD40 repeat protein
MSKLHNDLLWVACLLMVTSTLGRSESPAERDEAAAHKSKKERTDIYGDALPPDALMRLGTLRLRHPGEVSSVALSPDGTLVASVDHSVCLWDVATGKEHANFHKRLPGVLKVTFAADGKALIAWCSDGGVRIYSVATGDLVRETAGIGQVSGLTASFSPDGKLWATADLSNGVSVRRVGSAAELFHLQFTDGHATCLAFSPDGRVLASGDWGHRLRLWDVPSGKLIHELKGQRSWLESVAFSPDGRLLASASGIADLTIRLWEVATGKELLRFKTSGMVGSATLAFSPDGKALAGSIREGTIHLWDVATGRELRKLPGHGCWVRGIAFSGDGTRLAAGSRDHSVSVWDLQTGKPLQEFPAHQGTVVTLAFSPDGRRLASGADEDHALIVWDLATAKPRFRSAEHHRNVLTVAYSPDGKLLASGDGQQGSDYREAQIRLWSADTGKLVRQFTGHLNSVNSLAFSPDARLLASVGGDFRTRMWDVATGRRLRQIRHFRPVRSVSFSPDGETLLVTAYDAPSTLWSVQSGQKVCQFGSMGGARRGPGYAAFLPDGKAVLTGELQGQSPSGVEVCFWDTRNGRLLRSLNGVARARGVVAWALSCDGRTLATSDDSWTSPGIQLWDTDSGRLMLHLQGHGGQVSAMAFSPDSKLLASGSSDTTVLIWDVSQARLAYLWSELAGGSDDSAQAMKKLARNPERGVPFVRNQLEKAMAAEQRAGQLIAELDDDDFHVRERASRQLEELGRNAEFALRLAIERDPSLEVRRRCEALLGKLPTSPSRPGEFQPRSAILGVALLEEVATPEARQVLQDLARGPATSTIARDAKTALEQLAKRHPAPGRKPP